MIHDIIQVYYLCRGGQANDNGPVSWQLLDSLFPPPCRSETVVKAQHLEHYRGFNFWRFDLTILCGLPERTIEYMLIHSQDHAFSQQKR